MVLQPRFDPRRALLTGGLAELYTRATHRHGDHHGPGVSTAAPGLEDHLGWLREVGFADVDCVRKHLSEVFLAAVVLDASSDLHATGSTP